jgi:hypothetical protein
MIAWLTAEGTSSRVENPPWLGIQAAALTDSRAVRDISRRYRADQGPLGDHAPEHQTGHFVPTTEHLGCGR